MARADARSGLFPALLKHWRRQRGLSQLDLALSAGVSARHVSFLETGRSNPSPEMVLQLGTSLGVPLRQVNAMLRAAGHEPAYDETSDVLPDPVAEAIELLKSHHEPFPLVVLDRTYRVLDLNGGALGVLAAVLGEAPTAERPAPGAIAALGLNLARTTFDPHGAQPHVANFDEVGRQLLWRIQREVLADPDDGEMQDLLDDLLALPTVDPAWREVDLLAPSDPALVLHLRRKGLELRFLTTITAFQAPQAVAVEHLRIETWLPYDQATAEACRALAPGAHRSGDPPPG
ncbi:MAG: helix-turn-helix domain-containing protein [Actinobacteria bacterium]|nr:helix-turn-helix domain-containing protein [Actinomycetota bacterium]